MTAAGDKKYCPVCRSLVGRPFRPGPNGRAGARCPRCGGLERHRFFALLLELLAPHLGEVGTILEVAPTPQTTACLAALGPQRHLRLDLGLDNRLVDALGDLTRLPVRDGVVDLLVCYHVLEHVPDDHAAMREIARVLAPGGTAVVQVPIRWGTTTDEDPDAPEDERITRFGQADHVRFYGDDFEDRLNRHGLSFHRVTPVDLVGPALCDYLTVVPGETVWLVRRGPDPVAPLTHDGLLALHEGMLAQLRGVTAERDRARRRLARLEGRAADARGARTRLHPLPRLARRAAGRARRVVARRARR